MSIPAAPGAIISGIRIEPLQTNKSARDHHVSTVSVVLWVYHFLAQMGMNLPSYCSIRKGIVG